MNWVLWAYVPDEPVATLSLAPSAAPLTIGRDATAAIRLQHASVSRTHAQLIAESGGWRVQDLGSKNGVRVGGRRVDAEGVRAGEWFVIGDVYCRLQSLDGDAARERAAQVTQRRELSRAGAARVVAAVDTDAMFASLVASFVATAGCRRGFVLIGERSEALRVRACFQIDTRTWDREAFGGSTGVIERALRERRPVLAGDALALPWLRERASVVGQGLRAAVCLPLVHEGRMLGALYADTDEAGRQFTSLDAELLSEWAQQAVLLRVAQALDERIADLTRCVMADEQGRPSDMATIPNWRKATG